MIYIKLYDFKNEPKWIEFKNTYATKLSKAVEIEKAETFIDGVIQGICCATPESVKFNLNFDCTMKFDGFILTVLEPAEECFLDDIDVLLEITEE